jgi:uncharacterized membrane protein
MFLYVYIKCLQAQEKTAERSKQQARVLRMRTRLVMILKIHPLIVKLGIQTIIICTIYLVPFNQLAKLFDLLRCFDCGSTFKLQKICSTGVYVASHFLL